jgi:methionine synthase / methylenetetrahydrofolate reductase (NADH)
MDPQALRELLASGPLLADGGMGSALIERGIAEPDGCIEIVNLTEADAIADVHREFVDAGSKLVETNTFGANRFALAQHDLGHRLEEINRRGVRIAKEAGVLVGGSVGPLRVRLAPYGRVRRKQAREAYAEQIAVLADAGADLIVIETQSDLNEIAEALRAAREACDLAVVCMATFTRDDRTLLGSTPEAVALRLAELGADVIGVNCSEGPAQVLRIVNAMRTAVPEAQLIAKPNAGGPTRVGERIVYPATPEYLGEYARAFVAAGASFVGGCCGTHPGHIAAMAEALAKPRQLHLEMIPATPAETAAETGQPASELGTKLRDARFVVTVEMDPPRSTSTAKMLAGAETLRDAGADAINIADNPMARMRMSPWAPARLIQERIGIDTVLHFPIRGRNLLRIQGDLLAAHALGIRNLFVVLGDPTRIGDYPAATDNVDVVPTGLISLVTQSLNRGTDQLGASIEEPTSFVVGCAVNMASADIDKECKLLKKKIDSGADFALSMPTFSADTLRTFRKEYEQRHGTLSLPILVGLLPLVTARHAEFLHNELPGVSIPADVRSRMTAAGGKKKKEEAAGLAIAIDLGHQLRGDAAGIYLMPPFGRFDIAAEIVEAVQGRS